MKCFLRTLTCTTAAILAILSANVMAATIDDFSDNADGLNGVAGPTIPFNTPNTSGPVWTHLFGAVGSTGQTWDTSTGEYRLKAPTNGAVSSGQQLGFVGSIAGPSSTDVNVMADLVEPTGSPSAVALGYLVGVMAHTNGSNIPGGLTGYVFGYNQSGLPGTPRIEITKIKLGGSTSVVAASAAIPALDLLNKNYTFSLTSSGNTWTGDLFETGGPLVATTSGTDASSPFTSGFSGLFGLSGSIVTGPVDVTFDNFKTADVPEPVTSLLVALGAGLFLFRRRSSRS